MSLATVVNLKNENSKRRLNKGGKLWLVEKEELRKELLARRKDNSL
jgi:16S rRNA G1207 methylase RsmC